MEENNYTFPPVEKSINWLISFIFYYRLFFVILSILGIGILARKVYLNTTEDRLKNMAVVLTGGSIIIGIFYSIINYEHNLSKFKHDKKATRDTLTFTTACKMHETEMISHTRNLKTFYLNNKQLFTDAKYAEINTELASNPETRISLFVLFNYFEGIALGISEGLMNERFMRKFFRTLFRDYNDLFGGYFEFVRKETHSPEGFKNFTNLAQKWVNDNQC